MLEKPVNKMSKAHATFCIGVLFGSTIITGCIPGNNTPHSGTREEIKNPRNLVKVLDGVRCHTDSSSCPEEDIRIIWEMCLRNGYQEIMPTKNVISGRSIEELVAENITEEKIRSESSSIDRTDPNGIVTTETIYTEVPYEHTRYLRGVCSGSEYILN
jgi:hypothetical protein